LDHASARAGDPHHAAMVREGSRRQRQIMNNWRI
jgi:hypothetical protein